jgi:mannitol/fructose-specific phosphotransferase system IIA component (Ntr-type)
MVSEELAIVPLSATTAEGVIRALAQRLRAHGHVHASFEAAAVARKWAA